MVFFIIIQFYVVFSPGNVYIADTGNCVIRKVASSTKRIFTIAGTAGYCGSSGDGNSATSAYLLYPPAVCVDSQGIYYTNTFIF